MMNKEIQPSVLLGQFGEQAVAVELNALRSSPGQPAFISADSSAISCRISPREDTKVTNVAYCFDGSLLPTRNGCSYNLYNLMKAVAGSGFVSPYLFLCDRSTDRTELFYNQKFSTVFFHPDDYYGDEVFKNTLAQLSIDTVQFYSSEGVLNLAPKIKLSNVRTIFEVQNTDYRLLSQLNAPDEEVTMAYRKQVAAQRLVDMVFVRSETDAEEAIRLGANSSSVRIYKGGIDISTVEFYPERENNHHILFMGNMHYAPNQNAVHHILDKIMPELTPDYHLTIMGVGQRDLLRRYSAAGATCYSPDDLSGELKKYQIAVAPLMEGSGTRLKVLDYLASGIVTISTSLGIEGLDDEIENCVIVEDDILSYPEIIRRITADPKANDEMVVRGRQFVEQKYSFANAITPFIDEYRKFADEKSVL